MSRRRSGSIMGPPADRDIIMGPPPVPAPQQMLQHAAQSLQQTQQHGEQDITDKYKKLKRRYFELEEKHKEAATELARSGERNVKMRGERDILLDRIMELEAQSGASANASSSQSPLHTGAFPKSLLDASARTAFANNLRSVMHDVDADDVDPVLTSRHLGPAARKSAEEEQKRRQDEEARAMQRTSGGRRPQNVYPTPVAQPMAAYKAKEIPGLPQQGLLTFSPAPGDMPHPSSEPIMRVQVTDQAQVYGQPYPEQSGSPMVSPHDERASHSPTQYRNGINGHGHPPHFIRRDSGSSHLSNSPPIPQPPYQHDGQAPAGQQLQREPTPSGSGSNGGPDGQRQGKPKRLKAHTVTSKSFSVPVVPRGKKGQPMLPLNVGIMTLIKLGEVCMREHFHTERYIYPVGYEVTRRYLSTVDPTLEVVYNCTILDGGDGPKFQIVPSDAPERSVISGTATGAWSNIVKQANTIRNRQHSNSVSGPDFFGLGQNTIKHLIQNLPGADRLRDYVWQNFVEGGPLGGRHAAVIPALPEDYQEQGTLAAHHPDMQVREQRRRASMSGEKEEQQSPPVVPQRRITPPTQASLQTIILPPPMTTDTLTIQEYQPPGKEEKRTTKGRTSAAAAARRGSHSQSPTPVQTHGTRSKAIVAPGSRSASAQPPGQMSTLVLVPTPQAQAPSPAEKPSPYTPDHQSPANVPATFASIMNAYPASGPPLTPSAKAD